jgi:hypothetical protein
VRTGNSFRSQRRHRGAPCEVRPSSKPPCSFRMPIAWRRTAPTSSNEAVSHSVDLVVLGQHASDRSPRRRVAAEAARTLRVPETCSGVRRTSSTSTSPRVAAGASA